MIMFWRPTDVDERGGPRRGLLRGRLSRPAVGRDREDEGAATLIKLTGRQNTFPDHKQETIQSDSIDVHQ